MNSPCCRWFFCYLLTLMSFLMLSVSANAEELALADNDLSHSIRKIEPNILSEDDKPASMVREDQQKRLREANYRDTDQWRTVKSLQDWEKFRDLRIKKLKDSLGNFPKSPEKLKYLVTGKVDGDGFGIQNIVYQSRPDFWVTANLYTPKKPRKSAPGILFVTSHHRPKEQGELQDMGMTWARDGAYVLAIDHPNYGERREHGFHSASDFPREFRVSRQDYYFRYDNGMKLHLVGESLIGWIVWDHLRGIDLLLEQPNCDPDKIALLGAVAGGGDPCAVAAAIDKRIQVAVPFNFGGPQPESRPLKPEDAERLFRYSGNGGWESTRNLRLSVRDGFMHWEIVAATAPRGLIYAHEFAWDQASDPVWKRLNRIYGMYDATDKLGWTKGRGSVKLRPPAATHCTNIGKHHRQRMHPYLNEWLGLTTTTETEYVSRVDSGKLRAMTEEARKKIKPQGMVDILPKMAAQAEADLKSQFAGKSGQQRRALLRKKWQQVLGKTKPLKTKVVENPPKKHDRFVEQRVVLEDARGIKVPLLLLSPADSNQRHPVVVGLAHRGKAGFIKNRSEEISKLLSAGVIVCLADVRGTGETSPGGESRTRYGSATATSSTALMLGETAIGQQLTDLENVLKYLRGRKQVQPAKIALWGDSFAPVNKKDITFAVPRRIDGRPRQSEPVGGILATLGALFDEQIAAIYVQGGLIDFDSVLTSPFVYLPHDVIVPGAISAGDLDIVVSTLAPRPVALVAMVDHFNRRAEASRVAEVYADAENVYQQANAKGAIQVADTLPVSAWLAEKLK